MRRTIRSSAVAAFALAIGACTPAVERPGVQAAATSLPVLPAWAFSADRIFPLDRSLLRPEDGVVLPDGRILVADQATGLRAISVDGSSTPFGRYAEAGYRHAPPAYTAGPNGVSFEPGGGHVLVADIYTGAIWRTNVADETTSLVYQHPFGVNAAERDSSGAIWFTQSTTNRAGPDAETGMFGAIDRPTPDGALYRIAPIGEGGAVAAATLVADGLLFANGLAIDESRGMLYLAETNRNKVSAYPLDVAAGTLGERRDLLAVQAPDNLKLDEHGRLWVVSPVRTEILVVDPDSGASQSVFRNSTPDSEGIAAEWARRHAAGEPLLALMTPDLWAPMPGLATSAILTPGDGPVYIGTLGDALVKLDR